LMTNGPDDEWFQRRNTMTPELRHQNKQNNTKGRTVSLAGDMYQEKYAVRLQISQLGTSYRNIGSRKWTWYDR